VCRNCWVGCGDGTLGALDHSREENRGADGLRIFYTINPSWVVWQFLRTNWVSGVCFPYPNLFSVGRIVKPDRVYVAIDQLETGVFGLPVPLKPRISNDLEVFCCFIPVVRVFRVSRHQIWDF